MNTEINSGVIIMLLILAQLCIIAFLAVKYPTHRKQVIIWLREDSIRAIAAISGVIILIILLGLLLNWLLPLLLIAGFLVWWIYDEHQQKKMRLNARQEIARKTELQNATEYVYDTLFEVAKARHDELHTGNLPNVEVYPNPMKEYIFTCNISKNANVNADEDECERLLKILSGECRKKVMAKQRATGEPHNTITPYELQDRSGEWLIRVRIGPPENPVENTTVYPYDTDF
ncbi:MAG: hypothetical protein KBI01_10025 [Oscillospiraceae bacterium]|nr:hypothetical protein [Oscillospiraceae bacterium]